MLTLLRLFLSTFCLLLTVAPITNNYSPFEDSFDPDSDYTNPSLPCDPSNEDRINLIQDYIKTHKESLSDSDLSLIKFIAGECLPVVLVPGLYGNKFQLHITNCTALNEFHPEIAKACKFDKQCKNDSEKYFWISEKFETKDGSTCFGELIKMNIYKNETETDLSKKFIELPTRGFRLVYMGNTPQTEKMNECGFGASTNLLDKMFYFNSKSARGLLDIKKHFVSLGYQIGVNLFSVPYDWRRTSNDPFNHQMIKSAVDLAYQLTGKRSVIVGHSYGSLVALDYVYSLTDEERENKVERLIGVGAVYGGASKAIKGFILGYEEFNINVKFIIDVVNIYISIQNQKISLYKNTGPFELFQKLFWNIHKDKEFMISVRNRTFVEDNITECVRDYFNKESKNNVTKEEENITEEFNKIRFLQDSESDNNIFIKNTKFGIFGNPGIKLSNLKEDDEINILCIEPIKKKYSKVLENFKLIFPFFPDLTEGCNLQKMSQTTCEKSPNCKLSIWDKYCRLNFFLPFDIPAIEIQDEVDNKDHKFDLLTKESIFKLIEKYGMGVPDMDYINYVFDSINPSMHVLDYPKVPVTIYYNSNSKTSLTFSLPKNPKTITDRNEYVINILGEEISKNGGGDGTVPTASAILAPMKWATQSRDNKYPVHFVNYCANKDEKPIDLDNHQYINIGCRCESPTSDECLHSTMIGDDNIIFHISNYARNERNLIKMENLLQNIDLVSKGINHIENGIVCSNLKKVEEMFKDKYSL